MCHLLQIALHHISVSRVDQDLLPIAHCLQQFLIILLFLDDLFFGAEVFSLLSDPLLELILNSQLPLLLLEHQLVVLGAHVLLHLLLTSLEFAHDLPLTPSDCFAIVTLSRSQEIKRFLPILLRLIEARLLHLVVVSHFESALASLRFGFLDSILHHH